MPTVKNLQIKKQTGSDNLYYATWEFDGGYQNVSSGGGSGGVSPGDLVSVRAGATWYNGVGIDDFVFNERWYVLEVCGDRAVIDENESHTNSICSPINVADLIGGTASSSGGSTQTGSADDSTLDHYNVSWFYDSGDGVWFEGSIDQSAKHWDPQSTYSPPNNAIGILVSVYPVAQNHKVNDEDVPYWYGDAVGVNYYFSNREAGKTPSTPTVEAKDYTLTASIENITDRLALKIGFEVYDTEGLFRSGVVNVKACRATFSCTVNAGGSYRVRARSINLAGSTELASDWSEFSSAVKIVPSAPEKITSIKATSDTSVRLEWTGVPSADEYEIEYAEKSEYLGNSNASKSQGSIKSTSYELTGLTTGKQYFFRVRAKNDKGESGYTMPVSISIGKAPAAPTTWSSTTRATTGNPITLFWVHNAKDNSSETYAELVIWIDGVKETHTIQNTRTGDDKDRTSSYVFTVKSAEGAKIQWQCRTAGVTKSYGEWSAMRVIDVYSPPTLALAVTNKSGASIETVSSLPVYVTGKTGPKTQSPIGYHVSVTAETSYTTRDARGEVKMVSAGDAVYETFVDTADTLNVELSAANVTLVGGQRYKVEAIASMNSGLTAKSSREITVQWDAITLEPNAEIAVDLKTACAYVRPYCYSTATKAVTTDVLLAVYRRNFDGTFTEVAKDLDGARNVYVTDPHPALDYARYRIVATSKSTGEVAYRDCPGIPVGYDATIFQWDERWSDLSSDGAGRLATQPVSGSKLELSGNVDITSQGSTDVTLVKYVGRENPVSYHGTQIGETASFKCEIRADDVDTLYQVRRLKRYQGDVYFREPSGVGYWASVQVSYTQTHAEVTIPVTINITRVEGGL